MNDKEPLSVVKSRVEDLAIRNAEAVVESLTAIAKDASVSARDRVTAGSAVLRAGGFYGTKTEALDKELHEMTAAELAAEIEKLNRRKASSIQTDRGNGLFD